MEEKIDDGSLSFLKIPRDTNNRSFNCDVVRQSKIVNTTFWIFDYIEDVPTHFSKDKGKSGQTLVLIKPEKDSPDCDAKKFFSGSAEILWVLQHVKEMNAFPRRVTLRSCGNRYYFE